MQHLSLLWCRGAIVRHEASSKRSFDLVVYARPDLVWWKPTLPWCAWPSSREMLACRDNGCDMTWIAPRSQMERLMSTALMHRDCSRTLEPSSGGGRCCHNSEALMTYARRGIPIATAASRFMATRDAEPLWSGLKAHVSLLRYVKDVCRLAFNPAFHPSKVEPKSLAETNAQRFIPMRGLPIATIVNLRNVINQSVSECHRVLRFVS